MPLDRCLLTARAESCHNQALAWISIAKGALPFLTVAELQKYSADRALGQQVCVQRPEKKKSIQFSARTIGLPPGYSFFLF